MGVAGHIRPFKLLVVDDEEEVVPIFRQRMLREVRSGVYELFFARSGLEALELIRRELCIDLVSWTSTCPRWTVLPCWTGFVLPAWTSVPSSSRPTAT